MSRSHSAAATTANAAPLFAALGDPTRLRLVSRLSSDGPLSTARLSEGTGVTRQAVTKHLDALAHAGVVHDRRRGRERIWELEPARLQKARAYLEAVSEQWDVTIGRFKEFVENEPNRPLPGVDGPPG